MQRIGVFGGSFDPPHIGHRSLVEVALNQLKLDEVWVIPVGNPVHRTLTAHISAQQRLAWVESMFEGLSRVRVLDWEVQQDEEVPAIETMRYVAKQLNVVPCWLLGMDVWQGLPSWVAYPEHRGVCNVAVFPRQGEKVQKHTDWLEVTEMPQDLDVKAGHVYYVDSNLPDISATQIRRDILTGKNVSAVLDARIADEIQIAYAFKGSNGVNE